jgi:hypothetical protein
MQKGTSVEVPFLFFASVADVLMKCNVQININ